MLNDPVELKKIVVALKDVMRWLTGEEIRGPS